MENIERKMVELKGEILGEKSEMWQKNLVRFEVTAEKNGEKMVKNGEKK